MNAPRATPVRLYEPIAWLLVGVPLGLVAWAFLATTFMIYDDEGYVLWSLKSVSEGAPLYTEVFSQYGPLPYVLYKGLALAGYPFTSDAARVSTFVCWLGTAVAAGLMTRRLTGPVAGLTCFGFAFLALADMRSEPGHPGGLLALLAALAAWLGVRAIITGRWSAFALIQPTFGTAMLLSKVNVGVFHLIATASAWPFTAPRMIGPATRRVILATGAVAGATVLMSGLLTERPVQIHLLVFCCAAVPLALLAPAPSPDCHSTPQRALGLATAASGSLAAVILVTTVLGGTIFADLVHEGLLAPLRHPGVYHHFFQWEAPALPLAFASVVLFAVHLFGPFAWKRPILVAGRIAALLVLLRGWSQSETVGIERSIFQFLPPLAWMLATPLGDSSGPLVRARWWLAWLACWHSLQAYPVAGSQVAWGSFALLPLAFVSFDDLLVSRARARMVLAGALGLLAVAGVVKVGRFAMIYWRESEPLGLPGAQWVRLDPVSTSTWRTIAANVRANASTLFTYPGMLSLNRWTGVPPPTNANVTHWFSLLNPAQQTAIRDRLAADPTAVVVVQQDHLLYLIKRGLGPMGPLKDYLHANFRPVLRLDGFAVWTRPGQPFTPVSVARVLEATGTPRLILFTPAPPDRVARLGLRDLRSGSSLPEWSRDADWSVQPWSATVHRLTLPLDPGRIAAIGKHVELLLLDAEGRTLDRLRIDTAPSPAAAFSAAAPP